MQRGRSRTWLKVGSLPRTVSLLIVGLGLGLFPALLLAQESKSVKPELFQLEILPQWELKEIDGTKFGCYTDDGVRELRRADLKFKLTLKEAASVKSINAQLAEALKLRTDVNNLFVANAKIYDTMLQNKDKTILGLTKNLDECNSSVRAADIVLPVVLGAVALIALAFAGGYVLRDYTRSGGG